jgi:hypothetical protein
MNKHIVKSQEFKQRFEKILTGKWSRRLEEIRGFSQERIEAIELKYNILLPESYKVFLSEFGDTSKNLLESFDMGDDHPLEMTEFFYDVFTIPEGEYIPPTNVPLNIFVFASYLYEDFYFFFLENNFDDPPFYLANIYQGGGQPFKFEKVGESVWDFLEEPIKFYEDGKKEGRWFADD